MILYEGESKLDGKNIVVVLTGLERKSNNPKTGDMLQTFIMRQDIAPNEALKTGDDYSVCGDCKHRPINKGKCYVNVWQAPLQVWKKYKRGGYDKPSESQIREAVTGRMVRLGAYGDPMAVPMRVWTNVIKTAKGHTGYTHQWDMFSTNNGKWQALVMASADTPEEARHAKQKGFRYFRVMPKNTPLKDLEDIIKQAEVLCPASKEAGEKTQCAKCKLCSGTTSKSWKSIAIVQH